MRFVWRFVNDETTFATTGIRCQTITHRPTIGPDMLHYQPTPHGVCVVSRWPFPPLLGFLYVKADKSKQGVERRTASGYTTRPLRPTTRQDKTRQDKTRQDKTRQDKQEASSWQYQTITVQQLNHMVLFVWFRGGPFHHCLVSCVSSLAKETKEWKEGPPLDPQHTAAMDKDKTNRVCGVVAQQKPVLSSLCENPSSLSLELYKTPHWNFTRHELMAVPNNHHPTNNPHAPLPTNLLFVVSRWPFPPLLGFSCQG